ncbi:MAG: hypothetical protein KDK99_21485, partial [Verrucomicrobiales bacterium]|nr:hypothetical protein [Verrucomicrobiales bacterium]
KFLSVRLSFTGPDGGEDGVTERRSGGGGVRGGPGGWKHGATVGWSGVLFLWLKFLDQWVALFPPQEN